jgi:NAD-dependent deacetylase
MTSTENNGDFETAIAILSDWINESRSWVVFTGAGISTESGIPDFRSPNGVWAKNDPVYFDDFCRSPESRFEYWRQKSLAHAEFHKAAPNVTHKALAQWEREGVLKGVITQNIDGLHQLAGSQNVLELHGTARRIACLDCDWDDDADPWVQQFLTSQQVPDCPQCGGRLKHATISFGQSLPSDVLQTAAQWAYEADLFFALGSSLVVEPAASLPRIAREQGARLVIINAEATPLDWAANLVVNSPLGDVFSALLAK